MTDSGLTGSLNTCGLLDHLLDRLDQRINEKMVLGKIAISPVLHEFREQLLIPLACEDHYRNFAVDLPDLLQCLKTRQLVAVLIGQNVIENNEPWVLIQVLKAFLTGFVTNHMIVLPALKSILKQIENHFIIIDEEDQFTHG